MYYPFKVLVSFINTQTLHLLETHLEELLDMFDEGIFALPKRFFRDLTFSNPVKSAEDYFIFSIMCKNQMYFSENIRKFSKSRMIHYI